MVAFGIIFKMRIILFLMLSFAFAFADACIKIIDTLAPKPPALLYSVKAYAQYQRDLEGKTTQTAPTHIGVRIDIPILDKREELELKEKYLTNLREAHSLLKEYLALRYEIEEMEKFLKWQWLRVDAGIEYRKDVWQLQISLFEKKGKLKALTKIFIASGISEKLLDECFKSR